MVEKLNKVVHIERQLVQRLGREPRPEEIAEELEITTDEVREILRMAQMPVSLEKPIGEEESCSATSCRTTRPSRRSTPRRSLRRRDVEHALMALPERERKVIELASASRRAALHARGGRARVRRHPRADPPDREQHAQEARGASRGSALKNCMWPGLNVATSVSGSTAGRA